MIRSSVLSPQFANKAKLFIILLFFLVGCIGDQEHQAAPQVMPSMDNNKIEKLQMTQEQSTQALTGLGLQIKELFSTVKLQLADTVKVLDGWKIDAKAQLAESLKVINDLKINMDARFTAMTDLSFQMRSDIRAEMKNQVDATANMIAKFEAHLDAMVSAQNQMVAGFNNKLDQTVSNLTATAGHDVTTTQFTAQMQSVFEKAYDSNVKVVYIMAGVLTTILGGGSFIMWRSKEKSRQRAEERANKAEEKSKDVIEHLLRRV